MRAPRVDAYLDGEGKALPEQPLLTMFRQIIANNRAGGRQAIKARQAFPR